MYKILLFVLLSEKIFSSDLISDYQAIDSLKINQIEILRKSRNPGDPIGLQFNLNYKNKIYSLTVFDLDLSKIGDNYFSNLMKREVGIKNANGETVNEFSSTYKDSIFKGRMIIAERRGPSGPKNIQLCVNCGENIYLNLEGLSTDQIEVSMLLYEIRKMNLINESIEYARKIQ